MKKKTHLFVFKFSSRKQIIIIITPDYFMAHYFQTKYAI